MNGVVQTPTCALRRCRTPAHDVPPIARAEALPPTERPNCGERTERVLAAPTLEQKVRIETSRSSPESATNDSMRLHHRSSPHKATHKPASNAGERRRKEVARTTHPTSEAPIQTRCGTRPSAQHHRRPRRCDVADGINGAKKRAPPGVPGGAHEAGGDLLSRGAVSSATRA